MDDFINEWTVDVNKTSNTTLPQSPLKLTVKEPKEPIKLVIKDSAKQRCLFQYISCR